MSAILLPPSALEKAPDRIRSSLLVISKPSFDDQAQFVTQFTTIEGVKRIDLVSAHIRGAPITNDRSDYPWYTVSFDSFRTNTVGNGRANGGLVIPLEGEDTSHKYGSGVIVSQSATPLSIHSTTTTISKPDGSIVGSTEIDSIVLVFRVYIDMYRGRESQQQDILG